MTFERLAAFVLSAFVAGISGGMFAEFYGSFNPQAFYIKATVASVAMLVVGGARSLSGAVLGTFFISVITEALRRIEGGVSLGPMHVASRPGLQELGVATAMLLVLLLRPNGLTGGREIGIGAGWVGRLAPHRPGAGPTGSTGTA